MRILLVEDDYLEAGAIRDLLLEQYASVELIDIAIEADFISSLSAPENAPPDLVMMDIMIPWQHASANFIAPLQENNPEPLRAGIRLLEHLQKSASLRSVPVILHSALEWSDIEAFLTNRPAHVVFVHKGGTPSGLLVTLRALLGALRRLSEDRSSPLRGRIWDAIEATAKLGGLGVNLRSSSTQSRVVVKPPLTDGAARPSCRGRTHSMNCR